MIILLNFILVFNKCILFISDRLSTHKNLYSILIFIFYFSWNMLILKNILVLYIITLKMMFKMKKSLDTTIPQFHVEQQTGIWLNTE